MHTEPSYDIQMINKRLKELEQQSLKHTNQIDKVANVLKNVADGMLKLKAILLSIGKNK